VAPVLDAVLPETLQGADGSFPGSAPPPLGPKLGRIRAAGPQTKNAKNPGGPRLRGRGHDLDDPPICSPKGFQRDQHTAPPDRGPYEVVPCPPFRGTAPRWYEWG
jgi:hypothetical protein